MPTLKSIACPLFLCIIGLSPLAGLHAQPVAVFSSNNTAGCSPLLVNFDASNSSGAGPLTYIWDFGNGNKSQGNDAKPGAIYSTSGLYQVSLVVKDANGVLSAPTQKNIQVFVNPQAMFSLPSQPKGCAPLSTKFQDLSIPGSSPIQSWQWDFGNGLTANSANPAVTYSDAGSYSVKLIVIDANGCKAVARQSDVVTVYPTLNADFRASKTNSCENTLPVSFKDLTNYPADPDLTFSYQWDFGDGSNSTDQNPTRNYSGNSTFDVTYSIKDNTGTCSSTLTKPAYISVGKITPVFRSKGIGGCGSTSVQFNMSAPSSADFTAVWDFGDGTTATDAQPVHNYSQPGVYTVTLTTQSKTDASCKGSVTRQVTVKATASVDFTADKTSACKAPMTVGFTPSITNGTYYEWDFGDGSLSSARFPSHTYTKPGNYTVKLLVALDERQLCTAETTMTDLISVGTLKPFFTGDGLAITLKPRLYDNSGNSVGYIQGGCLDQPVHFVNASESSTPIASYNWTFGDGTTASDMSGLETHLYTQQGYFSPSLTVTTTDGCTATYTCDSCVKRGKKPTAMLEKPGYPDMCCGYNAYFENNTDASTYDFAFYETGNLATQGIVKVDGVFPNATMKGDDNEPPNGDWHFASLSTAFRPYYSVNSLVFYTYNLGCPDSIHYDAFQKDYLPWGNAVLATPSCDAPFTPGTLLDFNDTNQVNVSTVWGLDGAIDSMRILFSVTGGTTQCGFTVDTIYSVAKDGVWVTNDTLRTNPLVLRPPYRTLRADSLRAQHKLPVVRIPTCFVPDQTLPFGYQTYVYTWDTVSPPRCACRLNNPNYFKQFFPLSYKISISDSVGCAPLKVHFQAEDSARAAVWNFGNGFMGEGKQLDIQFDTPGVYSYQATIQYDCRDTMISGSIHVSGFLAKLRLSDSIPCLNSADPVILTLSDSSVITTGILSKSWIFNGMEISTANLPSITYAFDSTMVPPPSFQSKGLPLVLRLTDAAGCSASDTETVYLRRPKARFVVSTVSGYCTDSLIFNVPPRDSLGIPSWTTQRLKATLIVDQLITQAGAERAVNFGSATVDFSTPSNNKIAVPNGRYRVYMRVDWDGYGSQYSCGSVNSNDTLIVVDGQHLSAGFTSNKQLYNCAPANVVFTDTSDTTPGFPINTWEWTFYNSSGAVLNQSNDQNPVNIYLDSGYFSVDLRISDSRGCKSTIHLDSAFQIRSLYGTFKLPADSICAGDTITLTATATNADKFVWDLGDGKIKEGQTIQYAYSQGGNRSLNLLIQDSSGRCSKSIRDSIYAYAAPEPLAGPDTVVCSGTPVRLHATNGGQYSWFPSPTIDDTTLAQPVATPTTSQTYYVTVTNSLGCKGRDSARVSLVDRVNLQTNKNDTICTGETARLSANGNGAGYLWSPPETLSDPMIAAPIASPNTTTTYKVVSFSGNGVCPNDSAYVIVTVGNIPTVDAGPDRVILGGQTIQFNLLTSPDIDGIKWKPETGLSCYDCTSPEFSGLNTTEYIVEVKTILGCIAYDNVTVKVLCDGARVSAPNAFSPNHDGKNDRYRLVGAGNILIKKLLIYNRYGGLVFSQNDRYANDSSAGWDGRYNGDAQAGTYVFQSIVICPDGKENFFKGTIILLR